MTMFKSAAKSHIGHVRSCNEDSFIENPKIGLWLVADGVGGNTHGDFASQLVSQTIERKIRLGSTLKEAVEEAHLTVIKLGRDKPEVSGMASTVVAAHFKGTQFEICWVGDSRAYLVSQNDEMTQLTVDHNHAQVLVDSGEISLEEAQQHPSQRVLMHAVGISDKEWKVDQCEGELRPGERLLLCSDGLTGELKDGDILALLGEDKPLTVIVDELIEGALDSGGSDNITLTLIELDRHGVKASQQHKLNQLEEADEQLPLAQSGSKTAISYIALGVVAALVVVATAVWVA